MKRFHSADTAVLVESFRRLGAEDPEWLAREETEKGRPTLARHLFLRGLWSQVMNESDDWMQKSWPAIRTRLDKMLALGVAPEDITAVVRDAEFNVMFSVACMLDDSLYGIEDLQSQVEPHVQWRIFEVDEDGAPQRPLLDLHNGIHDMDPTGRRGEPRPAEVAGTVKGATGKKATKKKLAGKKKATKKTVAGKKKATKKKPAGKKNTTKKTAAGKKKGAKRKS